MVDTDSQTAKSEIALIIKELKAAGIKLASSVAPAGSNDSGDYATLYHTSTRVKTQLDSTRQYAFLMDDMKRLEQKYIGKIQSGRDGFADSVGGTAYVVGMINLDSTTDRALWNNILKEPELKAFVVDMINDPNKALKQAKLNAMKDYQDGLEKQRGQGAGTLDSARKSSPKYYDDDYVTQAVEKANKAKDVGKIAFENGAYVFKDIKVGQKDKDGKELTAGDIDALAVSMSANQETKFFRTKDGNLATPYTRQLNGFTNDQWQGLLKYYDVAKIVADPFAAAKSARKRIDPDTPGLTSVANPSYIADSTPAKPVPAAGVREPLVTRTLASNNLVDADEIDLVELTALRLANENPGTNLDQIALEAQKQVEVIKRDASSPDDKKIAVASALEEAKAKRDLATAGLSPNVSPIAPVTSAPSQHLQPPPTSSTSPGAPVTQTPAVPVITAPSQPSQPSAPISPMQPATATGAFGGLLAVLQNIIQMLGIKPSASVQPTQPQQPTVSQSKQRGGNQGSSFQQPSNQVAQSNPLSQPVNGTQKPAQLLKNMQNAFMNNDAAEYANNLIELNKATTNPVSKKVNKVAAEKIASLSPEQFAQLKNTTLNGMTLGDGIATSPENLLDNNLGFVSASAIKQFATAQDMKSSDYNLAMNVTNEKLQVAGRGQNYSSQGRGTSQIQVSVKRPGGLGESNAL